jgi:lactoylglutathione lyase
MARIVHIALKVDDLEQATRFYEDVFGIYQLKTGYARGHTSRHMTDGSIDLALMIYDSEDEPEARLSGPGPCIHHFGIEVEDRDATMKRIVENGGEIFSDPEEGALKFRAPDGCMAEIVDVGRYKLRDKVKNAQIVHLALKVEDLERATRFYENVFGFKRLETTPHGHHVSRHMTDGSIDLALMSWDRDDHEEALQAGPGPRIHHWGFEVSDQQAFTEAVRKHGGEILSKPGAKTLRFRAPDRTVVEVVETGRQARIQQERIRASA